jgi:hypothetical protein
MPDDGGFFVFIWFVMMIGTIVGWIILLTAICRMARAHEEISETIGMALLGRSPRRSPTDTVSSEPSECMECHGIIPTGQPSALNAVGRTKRHPRRTQRG